MSQLQYGQAGTIANSGYYTESGNAPIPGVAVGIAFGTIAALIAAPMYAWLIINIPYPKINMLTAMGFGVIMGGATAKLMTAFKVRNLKVILAGAMLATLIGYWVHWAVWINTKFPDAPSTTSLLSSPGSMLDFISEAYHDGTWRMSKSDSDNVTGVFLGSIWAAEALSIFGLSLGSAGAMARGKPFCERCNCWCNSDKTLGQTIPIDLNQLRQALENHDLSTILPLPQAALGSSEFYQYSMNRCGKCQEFNTLTVKKVLRNRDKRGRKTDTFKMLVNRLVISGAEAQALETKWAAGTPQTFAKVDANGNAAAPAATFAPPRAASVAAPPPLPSAPRPLPSAPRPLPSAPRPLPSAPPPVPIAPVAAKASPPPAVDDDPFAIPPAR